MLILSIETDGSGVVKVFPSFGHTTSVERMDGKGEG